MYSQILARCDVTRGLYCNFVQCQYLIWHIKHKIKKYNLTYHCLSRHRAGLGGQQSHEDNQSELQIHVPSNCKQNFICYCSNNSKLLLAQSTNLSRHSANAYWTVSSHFQYKVVVHISFKEITIILSLVWMTDGQFDYFDINFRLVILFQIGIGLFQKTLTTIIILL